MDDEGEVPDPGFHEEDVPMDTPIIPSREDKPVYVPTPEAFVEDTPISAPLISVPPTDEHSRMPIEVGVPTIPGTKVEKIEEPPKSLTVEEPVTPPTVALPAVPPPVEPTLAPPKETPPTGITPQESSTSINTFLEQALDDITASIDSMKKDVGEYEEGEEPVATVTAVEENKPSGRDKRRDSKRGVDDDDEESDTDSEG